MTSEKEITNKRFVYTAVIGSVLVMAILAFSTI